MSTAPAPSPARDEVRGVVPKLVDHSAAQLDGAKQALDAAATKADRKLPGWYVDLASNKVAVLSPPLVLSALPSASGRTACSRLPSTSLDVTLPLSRSTAITASPCAI